MGVHGEGVHATNIGARYVAYFQAIFPIVDKGSEWILSVARHRDPMADPVGTLRNAEKC